MIFTIIGSGVNGSFGKNGPSTGTLEDEGGPVRVMPNQVDATRTNDMHRAYGIPQTKDRRTRRKYLRPPVSSNITI